MSLLATLGEVRIRELNDDINKLAKQKTYWEIKIRELGGDATKGRNLLGGEELPGVPGYRYYGAAKNLPGVRELFEEARESQDFASRKRYVCVFVCLLFFLKLLFNTLFLKWSDESFVMCQPVLQQRV